MTQTSRPEHALKRCRDNERTGVKTDMGIDVLSGPATVPLLNVSDLTVVHRTPAHTATVVSGVDFTIATGEMIAVVGESGSGKSVTAKAIMGLLPPGLHASGTIAFDGAGT